MPAEAKSNFDSLTVARQIIDLNDEVYREVRAGHYERAAGLRDQREALQNQLDLSGDGIVARNVKRRLEFGDRAPVLAAMEQRASVEETDLAEVINVAPLPPRWILHGCAGTFAAALARRLKVDALDSVYHDAKLPELSSATFAGSIRPIEWLTSAIREAARDRCPVVWIVKEPAYLARLGLLDVVMRVLHVLSTHFVVCLLDEDTPFELQFAGISDATTLRVRMG